MNVTLLLVAGVAALVGLVVGYLWRALRAATVENDLRVAVEVARAQVANGAVVVAEREAALALAQERLKASFDVLATESLKSNNELFLGLAREHLGQQQIEARAGLDAREKAIETLVKPIRDALDKTAEQIASIEKERGSTFAALRQQIASTNEAQAALQRETRNLVTALRRPEVRGQWGEITLRRLVELAGMTEHCDFEEQVQVAGESGALRPDLIIHMPEERDLVVDVKTPLDAYLEAVDAPTDELRALALKRHAQIVGERVRSLAAKAYWAQFPRSPDFVVLFIPGDQFLTAAMNEQPNLLEDAFRQGIMLATPSSFVALLKVVAYGWRQLALAKNAAQIRDLGEDLYKRAQVFASHMARLGRNIGTSVEAFNSAVGSLERQLLPGARKFGELGINADKAIETVEPVERLVRPVTQIPGGSDGDAS
ncbi:MAG TPA: DNA recombination protein RmuC [Steroidobacteraceae bacterium]|nr:DNA recombination protein RmuC [Steroidobacteraceae bacterium]